MTRQIAVALTALALFLADSEAIAGPFRNLDFEEADLSNVPPQQFVAPTTAAFPHWTIERIPVDPARTDLYERVDTVLWNLTTLGAPSVTLFGPPELMFSLLGYEIHIQGLYHARIQPNFVTHRFSQTGDVPPDVRYLELLGHGPNPPPVRVWLDDTEIALGFVEYDRGIEAYRYRGDVSAFAGRTATLTLVGGNAIDPSADGGFDAIQFVPEPSTMSLAFCGAVLTSLVVIRRSRQRPH
jgi:hypothetical protein